VISFVMPAKAGIQYAAAFVVSMRRSCLLDRPPSRAMTAQESGG